MTALAPPTPRASPDLVATAATIAACQRADGLITWFPTGHGDPWNHVEAAMALDSAGCHVEAARAYRWCIDRQRPDGSYFAYYGADGGVEQRHVDTNATAYVAVGALHHLLSTGDRGAAEALWPTVERAIGFTIAQQLGDGAMRWSVGTDEVASPHALVASSSAILISLRCAQRLAVELGADPRPAGDAARQLAAALARGSDAFLPKDEFAMDWYYPALAGALSPGDAHRRLAEGTDRFVTEHGVRCRSDRRWVTTAETAECAMAFARVGRPLIAAELLATTSDKRRPDGSYLTGLVYPERSQFPDGEVTSYSAAAVLLAADLLAGGEATAAVIGL